MSGAPPPRPVIAINVEDVMQRAVERAIERKRLRGWATVGVTTTASGGRTALENAAIAKAHGRGSGSLPKRNPFFVVPLYLIKLVNEAFRKRGWTGDDAMLAEVGDGMLRAVRGNLQGQVNDDGSTFRPLTPPYAKAKQAAHGAIRPILVATGALRDSLHAVWRRDRQA